VEFKVTAGTAAAAACFIFATASAAAPVSLPVFLPEVLRFCCSAMPDPGACPSSPPHPQIRVADDAEEWTVSRRYRNFESLHRQLRMHSAYRLKLPPKRIFIHSNK
jgi:hypothetical protein